MIHFDFVQALQDPVIVIVVIIVSLAIGVIQGHILGRAIIVRFPRLQNHAKAVSSGLFVVFFINAILSIPRFASPEKITLSAIYDATSSGEIASILFTLFGLGTGFLAVLAISLTIVTFVLLKYTKISGVKKVFVLFFSVLILVVTIFSRFTDYTPSNFEVFLYFVYQLGITIGIVIGTATKIKSRIK